MLVKVLVRFAIACVGQFAKLSHNQRPIAAARPYTQLQTDIESGGQFLKRSLEGSVGMILQRFASVLISLAIAGCCSKGGARKEPSYPGVRLGWNEREERGVHILGSFVLKTSEAIENGNVQIKVVELTPRYPCAEANSFMSTDRVTLRFVRKTDQRVLCEYIFMDASSTSLLGDQCREVTKESDVAGVYIKAINITDGWAYFELAR